MTKGRPKLVQEGSPLTSAASSSSLKAAAMAAVTNSNNNENVNAAVAKQPLRKSSLLAALGETPLPSPTNPSPTPVVVSSSLQRAAAHLPAPKPKPPQHRQRRQSGNHPRTPSPYSTAYTVGREDAPPSMAPLDAGAPEFTPSPSQMQVEPEVKKISPLSLLPSYWTSAPPAAPAMEESSSSSNSNGDAAMEEDEREAAAATHTIGADVTEKSHTINVEDDTCTRMVGVDVDDPLRRMPLVVLDGANIAYAYATALHGESTTAKLQPNVMGIRVACEYFQSAGLRARVVLPAPWMRRKPNAGDADKSNASMVTPELELLQDLHAAKILVASPPAGDDDAYCLTLARREVARAGDDCGTGFVVSNDMFRDAVARGDDVGLSSWLGGGLDSPHRPLHAGAGRIPYTFCDVGSRDDHGDPQLDFLPNPRHELVVWAEAERNKGGR